MLLDDLRSGMSHVRTALYVDFDNVFSAFLELDPVLGMAFAERPGDWLGRLTELLGHVDRGWLVRRCYMNPSGSVPDPDPARGQRLYFSNLRSNFTQAGFEVVDCPPLTSRYKTATDMHIVVDAMDALAGPVHYDEFVIVSGDADFTPLLVRLRADDRRIAVLAPSNAAEAFRATADVVVSGEEALALLEQPSAGEAATTEVPAPAPLAEPQQRWVRSDSEVSVPRPCARALRDRRGAFEPSRAGCRGTTRRRRCYAN